MLWQYFQQTEYFIELIKFSVMHDITNQFDLLIHYKSLVSYKPRNISDLLVKPDLTPFQTQKQPYQLEQKKLAEEIDTTQKDIDLINPILKKKQLKAIKIFERMIQLSPMRKKSSLKDQLNSEKMIPLNKIKSSGKSPTRSPGLNQAKSPKKVFTKLQTSNFILTKEIIQPKIERKSSVEEILKQQKGKDKDKGTSNIFKLIEQTMKNEDFILKEEPKVTQTQGKIFRIKQHSHQRFSSLHINPQFFEAISSRESIKRQSIIKIDQNSTLLKRFSHIISDVRPNTTETQPNRIKVFEEPKNQYLYPTSMKDMNSTKLELDSKKIDFSQMDENEKYTIEVVRLVYDIVQMYHNNQKKQLIIINGDQKEFLKIIVNNYFFKLSVQYKYDWNCALLSGRIYNIILNQFPFEFDNDIFEHFLFLGQLLTSKFLLENSQRSSVKIQSLVIQNKIKMETLILIETLALFLEKSKDKLKYLSSISTSVWHLLLLNLLEFKSNENYQQLFIRIMRKTLIYGNITIYNRIILRLNYFNDIKILLEEIYCNNQLDKELSVDYLFIILKQFMILISIKIKSLEFAVLKQQLDIMTSWKYLKIAFKEYFFFHNYFNLSSIQMIERGEFNEIYSFLVDEDKQNLAKIISTLPATKLKRKSQQ